MFPVYEYTMNSHSVLMMQTQSDSFAWIDIISHIKCKKVNLSHSTPRKHTEE